MAISYEDSGVDIHAGYRAVELMKKHVASTYNKNVLGGIGSFSGLYALDTKGIKQPVLVAGTDGVGTKLKIAFLMDIHNTCLLYTSQSAKPYCVGVLLQKR